VDILTPALSFAAVAGLLTIIPGMDTALVLREAINSGRRQAFATALGINTGTLIWGAAAATGVSALLTASHLAYTILRIAGALYLIYLGATTLWRLWRPRPGSAPADAPAQAAGGGLLRAWARGTSTNLLNPKVGVFYLAMLPPFIPEDVPHLPMGLLLAAVHNLEGLLWFSLLIYGTYLARAWLDRSWVKRAIAAATGTALLGFGLKLALTQGTE
jgi:threonine/homoserine/homoserine lactone efflux protein